MTMKSAAGTGGKLFAPRGGESVKSAGGFRISLPIAARWELEGTVIWLVSGM